MTQEDQTIAAIQQVCGTLMGGRHTFRNLDIQH